MPSSTVPCFCQRLPIHWTRPSRSDLYQARGRPADFKSYVPYVVCHLDWSSQKNKWQMIFDQQSSQQATAARVSWRVLAKFSNPGGRKWENMWKNAETICKSKRCRMVTLYKKNIPVLEGITMFWCKMTNVPVHKCISKYIRANVRIVVKCS